jgi:asparagine synthase (glutamine-hydrolysing)
MCGIVGFLLSKGVLDPECQLRVMADALAHRGPDGDGVWFDATHGIGLAHRRLAIIDLSELGRQPMHSVSGRYVVSFNGEIYNFNALRIELTRLGVTFRGHSDTEVMLAAFEAWGLRRALERFVGMFAIAVWDRSTTTLVLIRDRFGKKPLYYGNVHGNFVFGSELRAIERFAEFRPEIDRIAIARLLQFGHVPGAMSIYKSVRKLEPGSILSIRPGGDPHIERYWAPESAFAEASARRFAGSYSDALEAVEASLKTAVRQRMIADVPLGAFLSGGIDSSLITALMQVQASKPVQTFSIGFDVQRFDEAQHATRVATHLSTAHQVFYVTNAEALAVVPKLGAIFDEPFADVSAVPTYLVSQLARTQVTVALSGDGGDEIFGGYNRYDMSRRFWPWIARLPVGLRRAIARGLLKVSADRWDSIAGSVTRLLPGVLAGGLVGLKLQKAAGVLEQSDLAGVYARITQQWPGGERAVLGYVPCVTAEALVFTGDREVQVRQMMVADARTYLPDDILVKVDRASMAVSLEARAPYLDHRIFELVASMPSAFIFHGGVTKALLRDILARYVPRQLFERPKAGFASPLEDWLRGPLRDWAEALLDPVRLRGEGWFDAELVRALWQAHVDRRGQHHHALWGVLMFQSWLDHRSVA